MKTKYFKTKKKMIFMKNFNPFLKNTRKAFFSTSGDSVVKSKRRIVKFFIGGNQVKPFLTGRGKGISTTNHNAIKYYAELMQSKPAKNREERIYGAPPPITYVVRPVKLLKQTKKYHVVEEIAGPNLLDLIHFAIERKGPEKVKEIDGKEIAQDIILRRKKLADFASKHKNEIKEWSKKSKDFLLEFYEQIHWVRTTAEGRVDLYRQELKETDFVVEGFTKGKDGKIRIKLVMVDFK
jgi:hypothetical protein